MIDELRLGTRGSQLALWQARTVAERIAATGGPSCRIVAIKTSGDRLQEAPLSEIGGKRLFVKEIEDALFRGEIDLAVHSSKDMPAVLPDGLTIAGVLPREDPLDAVVLPVRLKADTTCEDPVRPRADTTYRDPVRLKADTTYEDPVRLKADTTYEDNSRGAPGSPLVASGFTRTITPLVASGFSRTITTIKDLVDILGQTPSIGTGSVRRVSQLTRLLPGARFNAIRGNLDTRLQKLDEGQHDALVLAAAGLRRLGFASRISLALPVEACVPAPGQGIVAIEIRVGDARVQRAIARIDDASAGAALTAERALVAGLGGGCQTPIGALARPVAEGDRIELIAIVVSLDGGTAVRGRGQGLRSDAAAVGAQVAAQLLRDGAGDILAEAQRAPAASGGIQP